MTDTDIRPLLDKYYAAETTPEEEQALARYFQRPDVPAALEADRRLFSALYSPLPEVPAGMEARLERSIDQWNQVEKHSERQARTVSMRWIAGMAASVALLFTLGTYLNSKPVDSRRAASLTETYDNPKDAAGETERALTKFSVALNKGLSKMNHSESKQQQ